jgi:glycosyl transferase family 25
MNSLSDIKHAFYINLESRTDRKTYVEAEFAKIGIPIQRFNAIKLQNGAIGCSMSHLKIISDAKKHNLDHVLIVEDDIQFTNPELFIKQFNLFLANHAQFDVVLIGGNNVPPFKYIDDSCVKVTKCQTTTGYLVKNHYYDTIIHNYKNGINKLMKSPTNRYQYAIDKYWFHLQEKHDWYLIIPLTVTQREDYSDIEKRQTNYTNMMLDLEKVQMFKEQQKQLQQLHIYKNITQSMSLT